MTAHVFIAKWSKGDLTARAAAQQHFLDLCELVGHPKPAAAVVIGVDADDVHVAHDQQLRVFKIGAVFEKLVIGGVEVFLFAFVFPAEEIFLPNVGPAVAAAVFGRAFFKSECHAGRVSRSGLGMADEFAKIKEMLLGSGAFREVNLAPLGDKILGGHGSVANSTNSSRLGLAGGVRRATPPA